MPANEIADVNYYIFKKIQIDRGMKILEVESAEIMDEVIYKLKNYLFVDSLLSKPQRKNRLLPLFRLCRNRPPMQSHYLFR